ncbi:hypothetical protein CHY_2159 [Carboxydothermus hydrogenoformans Z-2901]|uniref:Uncharacterized protein n=1 Tax=Carboxydothermus hydrogenoformans (strain ATCC BAA-161 / DSM 6008 / Z-2901) TaxID=246194 RepID=Q3AA61_CARHZ|nr:hypothetical protein CHY_2159 [Carboxydothermus hydrogenoformans Z-2901]
MQAFSKIINDKAGKPKNTKKIINVAYCQILARKVKNLPKSYGME